MSAKPDIAIIGPGRVGTAIGVLAARAGYRVAAIGGRNQSSARAAADRIGPSVSAGSARQAAAAGELVLLTVPDEAIASVAEELASNGAFGKGAVVAHCSGALASDALAPARDRGDCAVGSMHPLQTFPTIDAAVAKLPGAFYFIEGDSRACETLTSLAEAIGGRCVQIAPAARSLYHAAAVMACNYVTTLLDAALTTAELAGIPREKFLPALEPLVRATVDNVFAAGPEEALTGPVERGDAATVRRHLEALGGAVEAGLAEFYRAAGRATVQLALKKGSIDRAAAARLCELFDAGTP